MLKSAILMQKTKKYFILNTIYISVFLIIFFIIDKLNMSYKEMNDKYGLLLVITNIILNIIMAFATSLMMNLSSSMVALKGKESKGIIFGFISVLFGMLTYGCTPCVITFFATIGISFSVIALPLAGLPYKLISLLLIIIGLFIVIKNLKSGCKIKT
ncbi:MAG TPA: hypothetical protein GXZ48_05765 [Acholeplasmataceae bacterium]|nr:hypothetical protein [Acholeplasmataceae bacterium]